MIVFCISIDDFNYIDFMRSNKSPRSFYYYTADGKYLVHSYSRSVCKLLRKLLPRYCQHLAQHPESLLVRFLGMHRIKAPFVRNPVYFIVMSSAYHSDVPIHLKYDLKGSYLAIFEH